MEEIPNKLEPGKKLIVIAPSDSLGKIPSIRPTASERIQKELGVTVEYSKNCLELDPLGSSSIKSRIDDLHNAFTDKNINAIICATGGYNSNDLLPYIDWNIIKNNPKPFIGSSDITVLLNAIYVKTGLITYFGPNFYRFGMKTGSEYTLDYFRKCLFSPESFSVLPSDKWSEDKWWKDQDKRNFLINKGYHICNPGTAKGKIIGGNLCSFNLLQGTDYMPNLKDSILCIEDDDLAGSSTPGEFNRNLQSLLQQPGADSIKGVLIGRFLSNCQMTLDKIHFIVKSNKRLEGIPVIANVDFGHTDPTITLPIGGTIEIDSREGVTEIKIVSH